MKVEDLLSKVSNGKDFANALLNLRKAESMAEDRYQLLLTLGKEVALEGHFMEIITGSAVYDGEWYSKNEYQFLDFDEFEEDVADPPAFNSAANMVSFYKEMKELRKVAIDKTQQAIALRSK